MKSDDETILGDEVVRLRGENAGLKRRNRRDEVCLVLMFIVSFVGMGIGRLYWQAEGSRIACPETVKPAKPWPCRDGFITVGSSNEFCPDSRQIGKVVEGSTRIFTCTCPHSP